MSLFFRIRHTLALWGSLVKFSHSIFALPFALSIVVLCWSDRITAIQIAALLVCLVAARTAAMGWNRLLDRHIDAKNPRTASRELPAGKVSLSGVLFLIAASSFLFFAGSSVLGWHCLILSPIVLGVLLLYSFTKRFTQWSHLVLGVCLAMAPGGVWYALMGTFDLVPVALMIGVALWVAGFDIIYSCQDAEFDREERLFSLPSRMGVGKALLLARFFHGAAAISFIVFGLIAHLSWIYYAGLGIFLLILASQHRLVSEQDLSRADAAFFTRNGVASVFFLMVMLASRMYQGPIFEALPLKPFEAPFFWFKYPLRETQGLAHMGLRDREDDLSGSSILLK